MRPLVVSFYAKRPITRTRPSLGRGQRVLRDSVVPAENSGAYFIFQAGCIDNFERRYVNAASRTPPQRAAT